MTILFWHWWAVAGVLLIFELFAPGIIFIFLSIGAAAAGLVLLIVPGLALEYQLMVFAFVSGLSFAFGRPLGRVISAPKPSPLNERGAALIGTVIKLEEPIVNGQGRVRIGDTTWAVTGPDMASGFPVRVASIEGSALRVEPAR
jgi:membrane protein implicated in regulation of membrane protease activity